MKKRKYEISPSKNVHQSFDKILNSKFNKLFLRVPCDEQPNRLIGQCE